MAEDWRTPPEMFRKLHAEFQFDLDAAADHRNALLPNFLYEDRDWGALGEERWPGQTVFINPPYGFKLAAFVRRSWKEAAAGKTVVALIPMRTRAAWWHECVIGKAVEVRCVRKRPKFFRPNGTEGDFTMSCDSCLVVWRGVGNGKTDLTAWGWQ